MSDLHQSRRCNFLFKGNLKEEESGISFLFSSLRGSRFKSNPAPSDGGGGGRDDSAGTRETTRLTDSHSNINRNMAAPEGESSAEERKSSSTPPPKKNFTAANQNVFLFNSSSLVASFSLPVALCTQNSAYWLGLFEARSPTHTHTHKKKWRRGDFPVSQRDWMWFSRRGGPERIIWLSGRCIVRGVDTAGTHRIPAKRQTQCC